MTPFFKPVSSSRRVFIMRILYLDAFCIDCSAGLAFGRIDTMQTLNLKDKKVLVMGLGVHGGGVATVTYLIAEGAVVKVTDLRSKEELSGSLEQLKDFPSVSYVLGEHREEDFEHIDIVVANAGVPLDSPFLCIARANDILVLGDAGLFFLKNRRSLIGITGTRGKTTTTAWAASLLRSSNDFVRATGNTPENPLPAELLRVPDTDSTTPVVAELSSWQLEGVPDDAPSPHIACITNLYPDHLNRYAGDMESYANAKARICMNQTERDHLIVNVDNKWTPFFLDKHPVAQVWDVSDAPLSESRNGIWEEGNQLYIQKDGERIEMGSVGDFALRHGVHNLKNFLFAVLAVYLLDNSFRLKESDIARIESVPYRQEEIASTGDLSIINDSAATSPDAVIAAIEHFKKRGEIVLITGGTDKHLPFVALAECIKKNIDPKHLVLHSGSATKKLYGELRALEYNLVDPIDSLDECVDTAKEMAENISGKKLIVFSPGSASFEKFKHEFHRGDVFNDLVRNI